MQRLDPLRAPRSHFPADGAGRASPLQHSLQAALLARRTDALHTLLQQHGPGLFAQALVALTQRQQADILSLLAAQERAEVYRHLPAGARRQWLRSATAARQPLPRRLRHACRRQWNWLRNALHHA